MLVVVVVVVVVLRFVAVVVVVVVVVVLWGVVVVALWVWPQDPSALRWDSRRRHHFQRLGLQGLEGISGGLGVGFEREGGRGVPCPQGFAGERWWCLMGA